MGNRFCKKCLLDKVMGAAEYKHMKDYIKSIDYDIKTPEEDYNMRLNTCMECDNLKIGRAHV